MTDFDELSRMSVFLHTKLCPFLEGSLHTNYEIKQAHKSANFIFMLRNK